MVRADLACIKIFGENSIHFEGILRKCLDVNMLLFRSIS